MRYPSVCSYCRWTRMPKDKTPRYGAVFVATLLLVSYCSTPAQAQKDNKSKKGSNTTTYLSTEIISIRPKSPQAIINQPKKLTDDETKLRSEVSASRELKNNGPRRHKKDDREHRRAAFSSSSSGSGAYNPVPLPASSSSSGPKPLAPLTPSFSSSSFGPKPYHSSSGAAGVHKVGKTLFLVQGQKIHVPPSSSSSSKGPVIGGNALLPREPRPNYVSSSSGTYFRPGASSSSKSKHRYIED